MAWVAAGLAVVGTVLQVGGIRAQRRAAERAERQRRENALWFGQQQRRRAEQRAALLQQKAGQAIAAGQRDKLEIERQTRLTESRAIALAAASGGGVSTAPTVVNHIGNIHKRGAYLGAIAMYNGEAKARDLEIEATFAREEGELAEEAGRRGMPTEFDDDPYNLAVGGAILGGATTLFNRFGGGGPSAGGGTSGGGGYE